MGGNGANLMPIKENISAKSTTSNEPLVKTFPRGLDEEDETIHQSTTSYKYSLEGQWEDDRVEKASEALSMPSHRRHVEAHLVELLESIKSTTPPLLSSLLSLH